MKVTRSSPFWIRQFVFMSRFQNGLPLITSVDFLFFWRVTTYQPPAKAEERAGLRVRWEVKERTETNTTVDWRTETTLEAGLEPQEKGKSVLVDLILKFKDAWIHLKLDTSEWSQFSHWYLVVAELAPMKHSILLLSDKWAHISKLCRTGLEQVVPAGTRH